MSRLIPLSAVVAFLTTASAQAPKLDVIQVLKDISAKAQAAKEYSFEGKMQIIGQKGTEPSKTIGQAIMRLAVAPEGKYRLDLNDPLKGEYQLISNGEKSWAFVPKLKQYTEEETGVTDDKDDAESDEAGDSERDLCETYIRQIVPILSKAYSTAAQAGQAADTELTIGKKKVQGPVIRVVSKKDANGGSTLTDLAFKPDTMNVGRLVHTTVVNESDGKVQIRLIVEFDTLELGGPLPESTFDFAPPKGAKLVETVPIPGQSGSFLLNHTAPDFDLKTLDGQRTRLSELRGHPVLVDFWASWCGPCRRELPSIAKLAAEYKGLVVLGVNDEGKGKARDFASKNGLEFPILDDSDRKMSRAYHVRAIPSVFLIDADGKVVRFFIGAHPYESLKSSLKAVGL